MFCSTEVKEKGSHLTQDVPQPAGQKAGKAIGQDVSPADEQDASRVDGQATSPADGQAVAQAAEKDENINASLDYYRAAAYLAKNYSALLSRKEELKQLAALGPVTITKEDAIAELSTIGGIRYDTEHVQSSSLSNAPERIALLLDHGYVESRNHEFSLMYDREVRELAFVNWMLSVIQTSMKERMDSLERGVFLRYFGKHLSLRQIQSLRKRHISRRSIASAKDRSVGRIRAELMARSGLMEEQDYLRQLMLDAGAS